MSFAASPDWMPIRFHHEHGEPLVEWCYTDQRRFTEPFFDTTVDQCLRLPFNKLCTFIVGWALPTAIEGGLVGSAHPT